MKNNYQNLLLDPRWQKKRLEILQRDEFKCRACKNDSITLHVHHTHYDNNLLPWEYENDDLITLCRDCHEIWGMIDRMLKDTNYGWESIAVVIDLYNSLEISSINKYFESLKENKNE